MDHNSDDNICISCHAHWMQSCSCTDEMIAAAKKQRAELEALPKQTVSLKYFLKKNTHKEKNEK